MSFALVALPVPVRQLFTYRVPEAFEDGVVPGAPVDVPFRGRAARGVVVERIATSPLDNVREIAKVTGAPLLSPHLLELTRWVADYYLAPPGEVIAAASLRCDNECGCITTLLQADRRWRSGSGNRFWDRRGE